MIRDVDDLADGEVLRTGVCVVGGGFAGVDLVRFLGRHGVPVVLLEAGRQDHDPATQALARFRNVGRPLRTPDPDGPFTPYLDAQYRGECRVRQLGGTSVIWTGKWRLLDELTFVQRPWVPHSGWPLGREDLLPFHREVAREYGLGDPDRYARGSDDPVSARRLADAGVAVSPVHWQQEPLRLAERFRAELETGPADVVLGANVTELLLHPDHRGVRAAVVRSLGGRQVTVEADTFVLATGGLEAPRLLLASRGQVAAGIGNDHDLVGRFFMDHPKHKRAVLRPGPLAHRLVEELATRPRPRFQLMFSLAAAQQERLGVLDHAVSVSPVYCYQVDYPEEHVVAVRDALHRRDVPALVRAALRLLSSPASVATVLQRLRHRDRGGPVSHYATTMYLEQAPNPDSRLLLGDRVDAVGMPELVVDWRTLETDETGLATLLRELPAAFAAAGLGELDFGPEPLTLDDTVDAAHHIGGTRMAATAAEGVVDVDCRVYGVDNLYVATSSVFPTGDSATPTFTVMALARRLGHHLLQARAAG